MNKTLAGLRLGAIILAGLIVFFGSFYTVDAGERAVVLNFGSITGVAGPGLHFKIPIVQSVVKINTRVIPLNWNGNYVMEAYSKDQQPAKLSVTVSYRVLPDDASIKSFYTGFRDRNGFEQAVITPRANQSIKTIFGQFNAVTAIQDRARLNKEVEDELHAKILGPVAIEGVQIWNIDFSDAYENSVEQRMLAQVEVEKVRQNKDREQLQADIKVIQATADAQSVKLRGEAEASAIAARGKALGDNPHLVALVATEKWNGVLPTTQVPGAAVPFLSLPKQ